MTSCTFVVNIKSNVMLQIIIQTHVKDVKMGLKCEIDPEFRPRKGSQIQSLKLDVDELKAKIEMLTKRIFAHTSFESTQFEPRFATATTAWIAISTTTSSNPQRALSYTSANSSPQVAFSNASPIPSVTSIQQCTVDSRKFRQFSIRFKYTRKH